MAAGCCSRNVWFCPPHISSTQWLERHSYELVMNTYLPPDDALHVWMSHHWVHVTASGGLYPSAAWIPSPTPKSHPISMVTCITPPWIRRRWGRASEYIGWGTSGQVTSHSRLFFSSATGGRTGKEEEEKAITVTNHFFYFGTCTKWAIWNPPTPSQWHTASFLHITFHPTDQWGAMAASHLLPLVPGGEREYCYCRPLLMFSAPAGAASWKGQLPEAWGSFFFRAPPMAPFHAIISGCFMARLALATAGSCKTSISKCIKIMGRGISQWQKTELSSEMNWQKALTCGTHCHRMWSWSLTKSRKRLSKKTNSMALFCVEAVYIWISGTADKQPGKMTMYVSCLWISKGTW